MFRFIGELFEALRMVWRQFYGDGPSFQDQTTRLENRLRIMYGRGELTSARLLEMLARLRRSQIGEGDITLAHLEAEQRFRRLGRPDTGRYDRELTRHLNQLYLDLGLIEEARYHLHESRKALEREGAWVNQQVEASRAHAQLALPDESEARAYLSTWQRLVSLSEDVAQRKKALETDLRRIQELETEIRASIGGMRALGSKEQLAAVDLRARQDLLVLGHKR